MAQHLETAPSHDQAARPFRGCASKALRGACRVPGDKSISHRAVMLGGVALGETRVTGLLEGEDVLATAAALRQLGATVTREADGSWRVIGRGLGLLQQPNQILDMGNSGTAARLLLGLLAGHGLRIFMTGDASLRKRPMKRVIDPLTKMGAQFYSREQGRLPLMMDGSNPPLALCYVMPVASAQVKSAILLAGLSARGTTTVIETVPTRDHSERMLAAFGASIAVRPLATIDAAERGRLGITQALAETPAPDAAQVITLQGQPILKGCPIDVPADPSSAAFPAVAGLICPGSTIRLTQVGMNATRRGLYDSLREMGAQIVEENPRQQGGEPVADLVVTASALQGITVPAARAASMIDEYPVLAIAAAAATGPTRFEGVGELRVKESDRLATVAAGLRANGVQVEEGEDWMVVHGCGQAGIPGGGKVATHLDHRIAMSFLVMGLVARQPVEIDDYRPIDTSFPDFLGLMMKLGARLEPVVA